MARGPQVGDAAPDFELQGTDGPFQLSDQRGERVVLLFYPGDNTPVCTRQFCSYRDQADELESLDAYGAHAPLVGTRRAVVIVDADGVVRHRHDHTLGIDYLDAEQLREALESSTSERV
jgi:thioredoxin-dependent peroxiredoxin